MSLDDRTLLESWRQRAPSDEPLPECPDSERIWTAAAGESSTVERRAVILHTADCPACAETWRLATGLTDRARPLALPVRREWFTLPRLALVAASLVAVAGLSWFALQPETFRQPVMRATPTPSLESLLREGEALPRDRFLLRWGPGPPGTIYDVEVGTVDLKLLSRGTALTVSEYLVPKEALGGLAPGATVAWRVQATLPDGRAVSSATFLTAVRDR